MKKILLLLTAVISFLTVSAQSDNDYYLDMARDNTRYYFTWDAANQYYTLTVPQLSGDFKVYDERYINGANNQDQYIFGAENFGGVTYEGTTINLSHPGNNMSVQGGGIIYAAKFIFRPSANPPTLQLLQGSQTPVEPDEAAIEVSLKEFTDVCPDQATVNYVISTTKIDNPEAQTYNVTMVYTEESGASHTVTDALDGTLTGSFTLSGLTPATETTLKITATTDYDGKTLTASTPGAFVTPAMPILIGQIAGHEWDPSYGIEPTLFMRSSGGPTYYYEVTLDKQGEFSFVTRLDSDWNVVNKHLRYAPSANRVVAPLRTWMPYSVYLGSTENAWTPEDFDASDGEYVVEFDFAQRAIAVVKGNIPTGVEEVGNDAEDACVDVYTINGICVRHGADAAHPVDGLPAGFYIAGGQKYAVR